MESYWKKTLFVIILLQQNVAKSRTEFWNLQNEQ